MADLASPRPAEQATVASSELLELEAETAIERASLGLSQHEQENPLSANEWAAEMVEQIGELAEELGSVAADLGPAKLHELEQRIDMTRDELLANQDAAQAKLSDPEREFQNAITEKYQQALDRAFQDAEIRRTRTPTRRRGCQGIAVPSRRRESRASAPTRTRGSRRRSGSSPPSSDDDSGGDPEPALGRPSPNFLAPSTGGAI